VPGASGFLFSKASIRRFPAFFWGAGLILPSEYFQLYPGIIEESRYGKQWQIKGGGTRNATQQYSLRSGTCPL
jgi:hypothetical protein